MHKETDIVFEDGTNNWHCTKCNVSGDVTEWVAPVDHLPWWERIYVKGAGFLIFDVLFHMWGWQNKRRKKK